MICCECNRGSPYTGHWNEATQCRECYLFANLPEYQARCEPKPEPGTTEQTDRFSNLIYDSNESSPSKPIISTKPVIPTPVRIGPGGHLEQIIAELGLTGWVGCPCASRARQMDQWGIDGCITNRETILGWLKEAQLHLSWTEKLKVASKLAFKVNWLDPIGSIIDEAISRASQ